MGWGEDGDATVLPRILPSATAEGGIGRRDGQFGSDSGEEDGIFVAVAKMQ